MKSRGTILGVIVFVVLMSACSGESKEKEKKENTPPPKTKSMSYEEAQADWKNQKGLGSIIIIELGELNDDLVKKGEELFSMKCTACHALDKELLGPAPTGILERRTPEWIMNMILNPEEMVMKDPIGKGLLAKYNTVMINQGLTKDDARAVLEYFRTL